MSILTTITPWWDYSGVQNLLTLAGGRSRGFALARGDSI